MSKVDATRSSPTTATPATGSRSAGRWPPSAGRRSSRPTSTPTSSPGWAPRPWNCWRKRDRRTPWSSRSVVASSRAVRRPRRRCSPVSGSSASNPPRSPCPAPSPTARPPKRLRQPAPGRRDRAGHRRHRPRSDAVPVRAPEARRRTQWCDGHRRAAQRAGGGAGRAGVIISGGNVRPERFAELIGGR